MTNLNLAVHRAFVSKVLCFPTQPEPSTSAWTHAVMLSAQLWQRERRWQAGEVVVCTLRAPKEISPTFSRSANPPENHAKDHWTPQIAAKPETESSAEEKQEPRSLWWCTLGPTARIAERVRGLDRADGFWRAVGQLSRTSFREAVSIEQRGGLLGRWTLAADLPSPPVIDGRVEKAQLPMASATGLRSERHTARSNSDASQVQATWPRQIGGLCLAGGARVPGGFPGCDIWSGTQATKGGSIKDGAREGAGERTRRSVRLVKGGVQSLMDGIRRGTEPPAGSREPPGTWISGVVDWREASVIQDQHAHVAHPSPSWLGRKKKVMQHRSVRDTIPFVTEAPDLFFRFFSPLDVRRTATHPSACWPRPTSPQQVLDDCHLRLDVAQVGDVASHRALRARDEECVPVPQAVNEANEHDGRQWQKDRIYHGVRQTIRKGKFWGT